MTMNKKTLKLMLAGAFVACAFGGFALGLAWATPGRDITFTPIVGPAVMGDVDTRAETNDWESEVRIKGLSDIYVTTITIKPGGYSGWHSHPGPSFIAVKSGELTIYCACEDPIMRTVHPAGSALVEDAYCVHNVVNEGDTDLVFVVVQIVPLGAPRRIDEPAP
jgi:quercetin dioxygenase-like cupin family protein